MKEYRQEVYVMNPFNLTFGVIPENFIKRDGIKSQILSDFTAKKAVQISIFLQV